MSRAHSRHMGCRPHMFQKNCVPVPSAWSERCFRANARRRAGDARLLSSALRRNPPPLSTTTANDARSPPPLLRPFSYRPSFTSAVVRRCFERVGHAPPLLLLLKEIADPPTPLCVCVCVCVCVIFQRIPLEGPRDAVSRILISEDGSVIMPSQAPKGAALLADTTRNTQSAISD